MAMSSKIIQAIQLAEDIKDRRLERKTREMALMKSEREDKERERVMNFIGSLEPEEYKMLMSAKTFGVSPKELGWKTAEEREAEKREAIVSKVPGLIESQMGAMGVPEAQRPFEVAPAIKSMVRGERPKFLEEWGKPKVIKAPKEPAEWEKQYTLANKILTEEAKTPGTHPPHKVAWAEREFYGGKQLDYLLSKDYGDLSPSEIQLLEGKGYRWNTEGTYWEKEKPTESEVFKKLMGFGQVQTPTKGKVIPPKEFIDAINIARKQGKNIKWDEVAKEHPDWDLTGLK